MNSFRCFKNFTTEGEDTMEGMNEDDIYKYLGHMQTKQIKHAQMKQQLGEEYKTILPTNAPFIKT